MKASLDLPRWFLVVGLAMSLLACKPQTQTKKVTAPLPFGEKVLAAPHLYVEAASQFVKWDGRPVPQGNYDPVAFSKQRIGTLTLAPGVKVHLDAVTNLVHFPAYYELVDATTAAIIGKYAVSGIDDSADWYFPGNGIAYLNQEHLDLCGPHYTRKFVVKGRSLIEVVQPLVYIGAETDVQKNTPLFDSPTGKTVIATVAEESKVTVLGLQPGSTEKSGMALLVKTPFGLTGWHRVEFSDDKLGRLGIYACN